MKKLVFLFILLPFFAQADSAWLNQHLNDDTLIYVRIPSPTDLFISPKGDSFDGVLQNKEIQEQFNLLTDRFYAMLAENGGDEVEFLISNIFKRIDSPIEVSIAVPANSPFPMPAISISAKLKFDSYEGANQLLAFVAEMTPEINFYQPIEPGKYGVLEVNSMPAFVTYEEGRLNILAGMVDEEMFNHFMNNSNDNHAMHAYETQLDESGQGLFMWANIKGLAALGGEMLPPDITEVMDVLDLWSADAIAAGWGVSKGKGRLGIIADLPKSGILKTLPHLDNKFALTTVGNPSVVVTMSIPFYDTLQFIADIAEQTGEPDARAELDQANAMVESVLGVDLYTLLKAVGPEIIFYTDNAGEHLALQVNNKEVVYGIFNQLVAMELAQYEKREIKGTTYHHLSFAANFGEEFGSMGDPMEAMFFNMLMRVKQHLYWIEQEDYLVISAVPQSLMEHQKAEKKHTINQWLRHVQKMNTKESFIVSSARFDQIPRDLYYIFLQVMLMLGDMTEQPVDLFNLALPSDAGIPNKGTYGIQFDIGKKQAALIMTFESNPAEILLAIDTAAIAAAGIVAAVAIPAYMAYEEKVGGMPDTSLMTPEDALFYVEDALALAENVKPFVEEYFQNNNQFPYDNYEVGLPDPYGIGDHFGIYNAIVDSIEIYDGEIIIVFNYELDYHSLILIPYVNEDNSITWDCTGGSLPNDYRPDICKY